MRTLYDLPEPIFHDVLSHALDSVRYRCWRLSLRLVDHAFNEAVLYVYYMRQRHAAGVPTHVLACAVPRPYCCWCHNEVDQRRARKYAARFSLQSLLAIPDPFEPGTPPSLIRRQWKEALTTLRGAVPLHRLSQDRIASFSSCSRNPVFNDVHSAIVADAVGVYYQAMLIYREGSLSRRLLAAVLGHEDITVGFWLALSACVLGDMQLFDQYADRKTGTVQLLDRFVYGLGPSLALTPLPYPYLLVAIEHASLEIVESLLDDVPDIVSLSCAKYNILKAAIFGEDDAILRAVLRRTPNNSALLAEALHGCQNTMLHPSASALETIRLLARHFSPLGSRARARLVEQSCAVGDVALLKELSETESWSVHFYHGAQRYIQSAMFYDNVDVLRFLLDQGPLVCHKNGSLSREDVMQALMFNQFKCYQELLQRDGPTVQNAILFKDFGRVENMQDTWALFSTKYIQDWHNPDPLRTSEGESALLNAIASLRSANVRFLLNAGVDLLSPDRATGRFGGRDPLEIPWPYFNRNRTEYSRTQAILDAFGSRKLCVVL